MTQPDFGFVLNQILTDPLPPVVTDFSTGFIVSHSHDANPVLFPLDTPVLMNSTDPTYLAGLGSGLLYKAVLRVNAQLATYQRSARLIIVRHEAVLKADKTLDVVATTAKALGSEAARTGIWALRRAAAKCRVTPRLGIVPGLTGWLSYAVTNPVVTAPGTGYTHPVLTFTPPGAAGTVSVDGAGKVTGVLLTSPGQYAEGVAVTAAIADSQGGPGAGAAVTIDMELLANPLCAALPELATDLLAHVLVGGPGGTKQDALDWRGTLNHPRLIPSDAVEIVETLDGTSDEYIDGVCKELGLAIACDFIHGGYPFHAWANYAVQGALGVKRIDEFSLTDGATDAQELLSAGVGVTVVGDETDEALDDSGLIAVSYRNASNNPLSWLYNKTRGRDYIDLALIRSIRRRLGKENITLADVDAVLNDMMVINIDLMSKGKLVGFRIAFNAADNTVEGLRQGRFTVTDNTEEAAPILQITINRGLDRDAVVAELEQLGAATPTISS